MSSAPLTGITNSGHTPGPWQSEGDRVVTRDALVICDVRHAGTHITGDNARLIAAAPDLYEALKAAFDWWVGHEGDFKTLADRAARALSKAEGWR